LLQKCQSQGWVHEPSGSAVPTGQSHIFAEFTILPTVQFVPAGAAKDAPHISGVCGVHEGPTKDPVGPQNGVPGGQGVP
jgi:hypothetical protein